MAQHPDDPKQNVRFKLRTLQRTHDVEAARRLTVALLKEQLCAPPDGPLHDEARGPRKQVRLIMKGKLQDACQYAEGSRAQ